ncbi:MAG: GAF domain-containing protein [Alphaproteobacteria bacterium]|nr:GAF domain-containing protein [Alphaproteobacteria bacterium]
MPPHEPVDLTNCDREPIHIPGSIQPHGTLVVCDASASLVTRHAANAADVLGLAERDANGRPLDALIGGAAVHEIRNALARALDPSRPGLLFGQPLGDSGARFDVCVHRHKGHVVIEFEPAPPDGAGTPLEITRALTARLGRIDDTDDLVRAAARLVRSLLGYDRVMIYRFAHDGAGQVVSEARRADLESFLGQYFPASDIPQQARALYLKNTIRVISDADFQPIPIHPALDASGEPLDLSFAHLRSVSPIHCEYLRNMGVAASMSVSIVVGGELWGLIACHHYAPRVLSLGQRIAAEMFGEFFSLHLEALSNRRKLDSARSARQALDRLLTHASHQADILALLQDNLNDLMQLMPCDGIGLWVHGTWSSRGSAPPPRLAPVLARFVSTVSEARVWATHALSSGLPEAEAYKDEVSGVLAIPLSQRPRDYLFFFRKEVIQTVNWAGNPEKTYEVGPLGDRLTPRKSFAIWKQTVERQSGPWTAADREIAEATRAALVETVLRHNEMLADERSKADLRQKMLNEELNHRVKNILALIKSLVSHPVQPGRSLAGYIQSLKGRVQALGVAHDQVVRGDGGGGLADLLKAELSPYRERADAVTLEGPALALDSRAYSVMALVLHELATNAAKYGALSRASGCVEVRWTLSADGACEIRWAESGGPPVAAGQRQGFGSVLINRSVPFDLGGESEIHYPPSGVTARFLIPARCVQELDPAAPARDAAAKGSDSERDPTLLGLRILLVEDQLLIAMDAETMLVACGADLVETAASANEGLQRLAEFAPDAAVLDVNLGTGTSIPVAEELIRRAIPFVFATGYGDSITIPPSLRHVPVVRKPYDGDALVGMLTRAIAGAGKA